MKTSRRHSKWVGADRIGPGWESTGDASAWSGPALEPSPAHPASSCLPAAHVSAGLAGRSALHRRYWRGSKGNSYPPGLSKMPSFLNNCPRRKYSFEKNGIVIEYK